MGALCLGKKQGFKMLWLENKLGIKMVCLREICLTGYGVYQWSWREGC